MFSVQINAIETQIQALTEKKNQYCTLEKQVESVKEALNQIEQTAQGLDSETMPQVFSAFRLPVATTTIGDVQASQEEQQLEQEQLKQVEQQSQQLEQAKEESQQAQVQVAAQQEEITSLKQKLLAAERKAQASKEQQEAIERHVISEKEMLEEQKIAYVEHMKDLEDTAAQFVFPSDIENFIRTGKFEFDFESDLVEVIECLDKTPNWCLKARVEHLRSIACTLVREKLSQHLPARLLIHWKEYIVAETQAANQLSNQLSTLPREDFEPDYQELFRQQSGQHLQPCEEPVVGEKFLMMYGERPSSQWVNLVEDDEFPDEYEEEEDGEEGVLGVSDKDKDCWGEEWIEVENDDWSAPSTKEDNKQPELESGENVQIKSGEVCTIENIDFIGLVTYFSLKMPNGKVQSGFRACDFHRVSTGTQEQLPQNLVESSLVQASRESVTEVEKVEVSEPVLKVGSRVKVPYGRTGQVMYFTTSLTGEESVAVELTSLKGRKRKIQEFPISKVTVLEEEAENVSVLEDENIGRLCDCPDGRRGRIKNTTKQGRFVQAEVSFDDGTTQDYDLNSLWLLPQEMANSQAA